MRSFVWKKAESKTRLGRFFRRMSEIYGGPLPPPLQKSVNSSVSLSLPFLSSQTNGRRLALANDKCDFSASSASLSCEWAPIFLPQVRLNLGGAAQMVGRNLLGRGKVQNAKTAEMGCSRPILLSNILSEPPINDIDAAHRRRHKNFKPSERVSATTTIPRGAVA